MTKVLESPQQQTNSLSNLMPVSLLLVGISALSLAAVLIKLSEQYIGPNATVFNRFWIATAILAMWKGSKAIAFRLSGNSFTAKETYAIPDILLLIVSATVVSISQLTWAWSLTQTNVANANLLHNLTPIFATFGGWLVFGHSFDRKFLIGMFLTIGGAIAIGVQDLQIATDGLIGDALALLSAVFYAANFLVMEKLRDKFSATSIVLWSCFFRIFLTFPLTALTEKQIFPSSLQGWIPVFCLALFCQVIGSGILAYSLKHFSSGFLSLFLLLEPIITTTLAWFIFAEHLSILNLLTFFIILLGIYIAKSGQGANKADMKTIAEEPVIESELVNS